MEKMIHLTLLICYATIFIIQSLIMNVSPYISEHNDEAKPSVVDIKQVPITSLIPLKYPNVFIPWEKYSTYLGDRIFYELK